MRYRPFRSLPALMMCGLVLAGCASSGGSGGTAGRDYDVITLEELQEDPSLDLLTLIQRARPRWMQPRGSASFAGRISPAVVVDNVPQPGGVDVLRSMRVVNVRELRFLNARDATTRYGTDMISGAILITRR